MEQDTGSFIPAKYLTPGLIISEPRNMHKADIAAFLSGVYKRQQLLGPAASFRFSSWLDGHKNRNPAIYVASEVEEDIQAPKTKSKRRRGKGKAPQETAGMVTNTVTGAPIQQSANTVENTITGAPIQQSANTVENTITGAPIQQEGPGWSAGTVTNTVTGAPIHQEGPGGSAGTVTMAQSGKKAKQRRTLNSDALAIQEAEKLICTEKRNRRPRVRDS